MSEISRSQFLGIGASLAAGLSAGCVADGASLPGALAGDLAPDLVLVNGRVLTQDDDLPTAEAFATKGGRFLAVGDTRDVSNLIAQGRTSVIDAAGITVLPGFIDSHSHPSGVGLSELKDVNTNLGSIARIQQALRERANRTPPGRSVWRGWRSFHRRWLRRVLPPCAKRVRPRATLWPIRTRSRPESFASGCTPWPGEVPTRTCDPLVSAPAWGTSG